MIANRLGACRAALVLAIFAAPAAADVLVVDPTGAGDFLALPAAVAAARPGDTLLVRGGGHAGFTTGKGLRILRDGLPVTITSEVVVTDVPAAQQFVLSGCEVSAKPTWVILGAALGVLTVGTPYLTPGAPVGTIGPDGTLAIPVTAPTLPAGVEDQLRFHQVHALDAQGRRILGGAVAQVVVDASF